jgi:hypothetical protein
MFEVTARSNCTSSNPCIINQLLQFQWTDTQISVKINITTHQLLHFSGLIGTQWARTETWSSWSVSCDWNMWELVCQWGPKYLGTYLHVCVCI